MRESDRWRGAERCVGDRAGDASRVPLKADLRFAAKQLCVLDGDLRRRIAAVGVDRIEVHETAAWPELAGRVAGDGISTANCVAFERSPRCAA